MRRGGSTALQLAGKFFMRDDPVNRTLRAIAKKLEEHGVPYAIAGGMALVAHGYDRTTVDVDILTTPEGLAEAHARLEALGYVPPFPNRKQLRDTQTGVRIEFLVTGQYPGDGKPKPIAFPDPRSEFFEHDGIRYVTLPVLMELKLASGMTNPGRLKDLGDAQELIRLLQLPAAFSEKLNPFVRAKYRELWEGLQQSTGGELGQ